jgi:hypothetical protein
MQLGDVACVTREHGFSAVGAAEEKTVSNIYKRGKQSRIPQHVEAFAAVEVLVQVPTTHRANALSLTSARSIKRATRRNSPAIRPSPRKVMTQPGPGPGTATRPPTTTKIPPPTLRKVRESNLPRLFSWCSKLSLAGVLPPERCG